MNEEVVALRFDASSEVGLGHFHRVLSLANYLQSLGKQYLFVGSKEAVQIAKAYGISKYQLYQFDTERSESSWLGNNPQVTHVITDFCHHKQESAGDAVRELLQSRPIRLMVIDSLPPTEFQPCNDAIPQIICTPYLNANEFRSQPDCNLWVTGSDYAVLDSAYGLMREEVEKNSSKIGNYILLSCGGSDPSGLTEFIARKLADLRLQKMQIYIVVGAKFSPDLVKNLESIANQNSRSIKLIRGVRSLARLIANCAFVICRAGLIRYEAACLGKTTIIVLDSSMYEPYLRQFEYLEFGYVFLVNQPKDLNRFYSMCESLNDADQMMKLSRFNSKAFDLVDTSGTSRVLEVLLKD